MRRDFRSAEEVLSHLDVLAKKFSGNNMDDWPHLKNREDFEQIYQLDSTFCGAFDDLYGRGRDLVAINGDPPSGISLLKSWSPKCFERTGKNARLPFGVSYGSLKLDLVWDPLRGDPRFDKIVASLAPKD